MTTSVKLFVVGAFVRDQVSPESILLYTPCVLDETIIVCPSAETLTALLQLPVLGKPDTSVQVLPESRLM